MTPFVINKRQEFQWVKLVDQNSKHYESIHIVEAKKIAQDLELDLVCFNLPDKNNLAFCKILDYGRWKYNKEKSKKKNNKINKNITKEIRFSPVIGDHDIDHKISQVRDFLKDGDEVVVSMKFKGIQKRHFNLGEDKFKDIMEKCSLYGEEVSYKNNGGQIIARLKPKTKKEGV